MFFAPSTCKILLINIFKHKIQKKNWERLDTDQTPPQDMMPYWKNEGHIFYNSVLIFMLNASFN